MYGLIQTVFDEGKQRSFIELYSDGTLSEQMLMRQTLAQALKDCPRIIPSHGTDWILCTLCQFQKKEEDTIRVFQSVMSMFDKFRWGLIDENLEFRGVSDIADTCLVSVGIFRPRLELLHKRRGAPSVQYYSEAGSMAFKRLGYEGIADDFEGWTEFLEKEFT